MTSPIFRLNQALGADREADIDDILQTKVSLNRLGYYSSQHGLKGGWVDNELFHGIRRLQRDNGLKEDGLIKPAGETAAKINQLLQISNTANDNTLPANDNGNSLVFADCYADYNKDAAICRSLVSPPSRARCWASAAERLAACRSNRPKPRLQT